MKDFEKQKAIADKLSVLLPIKSEKEGREVLELLKKLAFDHSSQSNNNGKDVDDYPSGHIGIFKPKTVDGEIIYERDVSYIDRWTFFAEITAIKQKKDRKRIVLLGESVARGFLLEPEYTPALVLNKLLNANSSDDKFEVVDLAESNISMKNIKSRYEQCLDLEPDLVVILAGNNWYIDYLEEISNNKELLGKLQAELKKVDNFGEIKPQLEKVLENLVIDFLTFVSQKMKEHNFPVIMAIPEFNLLDCRSTPGERNATYLYDDGIKKWTEAFNEAQKGRMENDINRLATNAQRMIDIDPSHPLGYEMLADVKIEQQNYESARELLELGRDTAIFCRSNSKPRTLQITRKTILEYAPKLEIDTLDIPEVFKRHLNGKIPGKDLFLDYCHFSVEGIQVAMEPLADQILTRTKNQNQKILKASTIKPSKRTVALGYLFGAIHNEHWGQSYDLHKHHCKKALEASKEVTKTMVYYCDMMSRKTPNNLTKSLEMIAIENLQGDRYGSAFMHPKYMKIMEIDLVNAMVDTLKRNGINLSKFIKKLRKKEHGVDNRRINLLSPFYYATSYDEFQGIISAFFQARNTVSTFYIVASEGVSIDLFISFRVPGSESTGGRVEFLFNGSKVADLGAQSTWDNKELTIPGEHCKDGINELVISWPLPEKLDKPGSLELRPSSSPFNSMYYVFGEISHFKATGVKEVVRLNEKMERVPTLK